MSVARNLARIGKQSAIYGAGSIAATLLGIVLLPLYTRELTPAQFGDAELALRIVLLVAIVARLGLVNSFFRFFFDYEDPERRRRVFQTAFWALQVTTLVWALITALASRWLGQSVFTTPEAGQDLVLMIALGVYVTVNYELTSALFRVQERPVAFSVRTVINLIATAVLSYIFLVQLHMGPVGLLLGAYLGQALVYLGVLVEQRSWLGFGLDRPLLHSMLKFGVPLMPAGAAMWAVTLINRPIVLAVSTPATLGILGAGFRIGTGVLLLVNAFQLAWPAFAYSIKDDGEAKRTYAAVMGLYLAFMGWAALSVALVAPWFLRLLTTEPYWGAAAAITPIAIAGPLYGGYFIAAIGVGRKKANQFNWIVVAAAAVIEVIALLLLVPPFGVAGAGWSLVIAYGSMFALMLWREHRVFPVPYPWGRIARIPVVLSLALAATYLLPDSGTGALALRIAIAAAIPLGYIAIGFLTRAELARARAIVTGLRSRGGSAPPGDTAEPEPDERL
ncbi:MAG: oligosaccharide flippase family protein [Gaiellales bacterium]|nr:oligosaccharide flippase family protein [Gaiellales bacterium]